MVTEEQNQIRHFLSSLGTTWHNSYSACHTLCHWKARVTHTCLGLFAQKGGGQDKFNWHLLHHCRWRGFHSFSLATSVGGSPTHQLPLPVYQRRGGHRLVFWALRSVPRPPSCSSSSGCPPSSSGAHLGCWCGVLRLLET